jgi:hypothetical protein
MPEADLNILESMGATFTEASEKLFRRGTNVGMPWRKKIRPKRNEQRSLSGKNSDVCRKGNERMSLSVENGQRGSSEAGRAKAL